MLGRCVGLRRLSPTACLGWSRPGMQQTRTGWLKALLRLRQPASIDAGQGAGFNGLGR